MPSLIYTSALEDALSGRIDFVEDDFKVMLLGAGYAPDKDHTRRSDISAEIFGVGYLAGGTEVIVSVEKNLLSERIDITLGGATWPTSTITAAAAVYYKAAGGQADADPLVAYIDFGQNVMSVNGVFTLNPSTLRVQN